MTTSGIRRASPPQAVTKVRDNYFLIQVSITETPSADWRRLFYDAQGQDVPADFAPRSVEITGNVFAVQGGSRDSVEQKIAVLDRWMERRARKKRHGGAHGSAAAESRKRPRARRRKWRSGMRAGRNCRSSSTELMAARRSESGFSDSDSKWQRQPNKIITNCWEFRARRR